ncbi:hypothetical protein [Tranquillimonas alkanivorans]|uniref:Lipoprotein n=1 Tax=Tranquillimonas alkanivorans TaxID=441119 RepID=A0A1I5PFY3_9RHOB|nr:hypothetical protein [Tranquillimonas alkanivorans]SFP32451.1 hypothetical protein SAMN04488047_10567 [Tranquillimonas alkanivorans]
MTTSRRATACLALAALAACAGPEVNVPGAPTVRHTQSTERYGEEGRWHLFFFQPQQARSLSDRLALARAAANADPDCRWIRTPRDEIEARTAAQGAQWSDLVLAAPLACRDT